MKNSLYWLLSAQSFVQLKNDKVFGISNFFVVMSICSFFVAIPIGAGKDYAESFPYAIPFIFFLLLMVTSRWTLGYVSKDIQDKHWRTQLVRFKDPKFRAQRAAYPGNADRREKMLENLWLVQYDISFDNTEAPAFQKWRIVLLPGLAVIGLLIGMIL